MSVAPAVATFLITDIVGSTRLWQIDPEAMKQALPDHDAILRRAIEARHGRAFKHTGDGMLAIFDYPSDALAAAVNIQRELTGTSFPGIGSIVVRAALHTGTAQEREGDYFGPPLNRVARLLAAGDGGRVLVSLATQQLLADQLPTGVELVDLGEHRLRDLDRAERIFWVKAEGLRAETPRLRTLTTIPNNLPIQATGFVGRDQELAEVGKLVRGSRLVTLSGVGGSGKTRLALQTAADLAAEFRGGVWLVELGALTDPELVLTTTAAALAVGEQPDRPLLTTLIEHLRIKEALLVVDNSEHLLATVAELTVAILAQTPTVRFLVTSRELLGVAGEVAYPVPPMGVPAREGDISIVEALRFDGVRLFAERGEAALPGFRIGADDLGPVLEICRRLDGLPLALELATARLRSFSPRQIASHLDQRFRLLTGGSRTALPRQRTLEAAIGWSYELLDGEERRFLCRLSVFPGSFSLEAAERTGTGTGSEALDVLDLIPRLVDKSLVTTEPNLFDTRYRLLETIRQYGRERLAESGATEEVRAAHADYFLELAEAAEPFLRGRKEAEWLPRLDLELDNLRQAFEWTMETGRTETAMRFAGALWRYWWFRYRVDEGREWLERVLSAGQEVDQAVRARALLGAGTLAIFRLDIARAIVLLEQALEFFRADVAGGDESNGSHLASALINLGVAMEFVDNWDRNRQLNEEALELARRIGDLSAMSVVLGNLSVAAGQGGDLEAARQWYQQGLELAQGLGSPVRLLDAYRQAGFTERSIGDPRQALAHLDEASRQAEAAGVPTVAARLRASVGATYALLGDPDLGWDLFLVNAAAALADPNFGAGVDMLELLVDRVTLESNAGDSAAAARGLGIFNRLAEERRLLAPSQRREQRQVEESLRHRLGAAELERLKAEGHDIPLDQLAGWITRPRHG
ncbi:MAG: ATP-binding protein [Acidimicrobiia bacterium]